MTFPEVSPRFPRGFGTQRDTAGQVVVQILILYSSMEMNIEVVVKVVLDTNSHELFFKIIREISEN